MDTAEYKDSLPETFALVVVIGCPTPRTSLSESLCPGTRNPTVELRGLINLGRDFFRFTIMVNGPGQYFFAKSTACLLKIPNFFAIFKSATKREMGLFFGIFLIL